LKCFVIEILCIINPNLNEFFKIKSSALFKVKASRILFLQNVALFYFLGKSPGLI